MLTIKRLDDFGCTVYLEIMETVRASDSQSCPETARLLVMLPSGYEIVPGPRILIIEAIKSSRPSRTGLRLSFLRPRLPEAFV